MSNNFEISLVVFMPNITTNHAITHTNKPTQDVGRTQDKLVKSEPEANDLQAFLMFSQHPKLVYWAGKAIERQSIAFIKQL